MKTYLQPATEMLDLKSEHLMQQVEQSPYGEEAYSPKRIEIIRVN